MAEKINVSVHSFEDVRRTLTEVKLVLERIQTDLASVANAKGASLVGVEDAGTVWTGTDLETVLDEIDARLVAGGH